MKSLTQKITTALHKHWLHHSRTLKATTCTLATLTALGSFATVPAHAQTPSAAQMAQFKAMPPAQQKALAKSMGIDIADLTGGTQAPADEPNLSEKPTDDTNEDNELLDVDTDIEMDEDELKEEEEKLPVFGLSLFKEGADLFRPPANIPVPANYVLGPEDTIVIQLYGKENATHPLTVNREGQIQLPNIGPITVAGMTFAKMQELINVTVAERMVGVKASTTIGSLRTIRVFVLGEVEHPGSFSVGSLSTMTNAIFASGGITEVGSLRNIQLKRAGQLLGTMDLYDLLLAGDTSGDQRLLPGDVIFIPPAHNTVEISGGVNRPARYELKNNKTLAALIKMAGGLSNTSHAAKVMITRVNKTGERSLVNTDYTQAAGKSFKLHDGDQVIIGDALEHIDNKIMIHGSAKRPGQYSWRPGIRFTDIIANPYQVIPGTDIDIALLQSMSPETGRIETRVFSPSAAWVKPYTDLDPVLNGYDEIYLFDLTSDRPAMLEKTIELLQQQARFKEREQLVYITGSVKFPGTYPLTTNMSTQELIELAGGLTESAYGSNGEITRYEISDELQRIVMHVNVNLQDEPRQLAPGDTLNIKQVPLWKKRETITVDGEVMFPGVYTILPGETLMDVLTRAGGLTPYAYPVGAVFSREELRNLEQQRLDELRSKLEADIAIGNTDVGVGKKDLENDEAEKLLEKIEDTRPLGRMVIDLPIILDDPASNDFPLEDGDELIIPRYKPSVTVIGEVQYPTSHFYNKKLNAGEYIKRSGGTKKHADTDRIYIVKANGRVIEPSRSKWFKVKTEGIEPGDTIVIPLDTDRVDGLEIWSKTTQILYQAALGAAAVGSL
ncbi:SLBB domain-containing protein [Marinagarivorans algicola]|uniref:SLBB domain-containing protein n=1 Tax=Marinagarivorans algicola TaxID=1513270 RepID=UPI0009E7BEBC|nr:SLBB domain-containing protein [Marinagarivorans algicola]